MATGSISYSIVLMMMLPVILSTRYNYKNFTIFVTVITFIAAYMPQTANKTQKTPIPINIKRVSFDNPLSKLFCSSAVFLFAFTMASASFS